MNDDLVRRSDDGFSYKCSCQKWIPVGEEIYLPSLDVCLCPSCANASDHKEPCSECDKPCSLQEITFEIDSEYPLCKACKQSYDHSLKMFFDEVGISPRKMALIQTLCHSFLLQAGFKVELPENFEFKWGITPELLGRLVPKFEQWSEDGSCPVEIRIADLVNTDHLVKQLRRIKTSN